MDEQKQMPVEIIRSRRRKKTISAQIKGDTIVVRAPYHMPEKELQAAVNKLRERLERRLEKQKQGHSDAELEKLAQEMNKQYFAGRLRWNSIRYVTNQNKRFGSCTPATGTIRISHRVAAMPRWVLKYVVVHELAHLEEANHGRLFWALVNHYPLTERARGYLMAVGLEDLIEE